MMKAIQDGDSSKHNATPFMAVIIYDHLDIGLQPTLLLISSFSKYRSRALDIRIKCHPENKVPAQDSE